jgi:N-acyl-D-aspartate/D-glutamate deacylase
MLTAIPAAAWGMSDRGALREGLVADLNVFDPAAIGPAMPEVRHDLPGGVRRLVQGSIGIRATVVGGETILVDGEDTGVRPGQLLRNSGLHTSVGAHRSGPNR